MVTSWREVYVSFFHEKRERKLEEKKEYTKIEHERNNKRKIYSVCLIRESI